MLFYSMPNKWHSWRSYAIHTLLSLFGVHWDSHFVHTFEGPMTSPYWVIIQLRACVDLLSSLLWCTKAIERNNKHIEGLELHWQSIKVYKNKYFYAPCGQWLMPHRNIPFIANTICIQIQNATIILITIFLSHSLRWLMLSPHILFTTSSFACPFTGAQSRHISSTPAQTAYRFKWNGIEWNGVQCV